MEKLKRFVKNNMENEFLSDDFNIMVYIIILNSLGFFFLSFITSYVAKNIMFLSGTRLGFVVSSWTLGNIISATIAGAITDKVSKKRLIALGSFGRGTSYFICYSGILLNNYALYIGSYIVLGLGVGLYWTPFDSLISEKSHKHHRSYAFSRRYLGIGIGNIIGASIGFLILYIGQKFFPGNYALYFCTLVIYGFANWIAGIIFLKKVDENNPYIYPEEVNNKSHINCNNFSLNQNSEFETEITQNISFQSNQMLGNAPNSSIISNSQLSKNSLLSNKRLMIGLAIFLLAFFLSLINENIAQPFIQIYIMKHITEDELNVIFIYLPAGVFSLILAPKLGKIADNVNPSLSILITGTIGAGLTYLLISTTNPLFFSLILCLDIAIASVNGYLLNNIISRISKRHRGKIIGARTVFQNLGAFIGPILGGIVYDSLGDRWPFLISIFVELILIAFFISAFRLIKTEIEEK